MVDLVFISKSHRERQVLYVVTYMCNLKFDTNELFTKQKTVSHTQKTNLWLTKGEGGVGA